MQTYLLIAIVALVLQLSTQLVLFDCTYSMKAWHAGPHYICNAKLITFGPDVQNVTDVTQNHLAGKDNNDVTGIWIEGQHNIQRFPRNIEKFFPNLKLVFIRNTAISSLTVQDLPFPNLEVADFPNNQIEEIEGDTFKMTPNLKYFHMDFNKLKHVGPNLLSHLASLESVLMQGNICINMATSNGPQVRVKYGYELAFRCPPTMKMFERAIIESDNFQQSIDKQMVDKVNPIKQSMDELKKDLEKLKQLVEDLKMGLNKS